MIWTCIERLSFEAMMNLYQPNKNKTARRRLLLATIIVVFLFSFDILSGGVFRSGVRVVGVFIYKHGNGVVSAIGHSGFFATKRNLERKIEELNAEVARLNESLAEDRVFRVENEQLRALTNLASNAEGITAPIVSSFRTSPYGTFMVGAGSADGAHVGNYVVSPGGFVIGTVSEVGLYSSLIKAVFAPDATIDAVIAGSATLVEGRGAGNAYARVPHGILVSRGDPVFSPVFNGRAIGIVGSADSDSASAYSDIYIGLPVSVESLRYVYIEK
jgi:cell shape-determining protein MreC